MLLLQSCMLSPARVAPRHACSSGRPPARSSTGARSCEHSCMQLLMVLEFVQPVMALTFVRQQRPAVHTAE